MNAEMEQALWKLYDAAKKLLRDSTDADTFDDNLANLDDSVIRVDMTDEE